MKKILYLSLLLSSVFAFAYPVSARTILVVGDSISAAYGIPFDAGWVQLLDRTLNLQHPGHFTVVNASISGDTTSGGAARLPALLEEFQPDQVILELGGNDGLRGMSLKQMKANLQLMIKLCRDSGASVVLVSIELPKSYGKFFNRRFTQIYDELEGENNLKRIALGYSMLPGDRYIQSDGIHPTAEAQPLLMERVLPEIAN